MMSVHPREAHVGVRELAPGSVFWLLHVYMEHTGTQQTETRVDGIEDATVERTPLCSGQAPIWADSVQSR